MEVGLEQTKHFQVEPRGMQEEACDFQSVPQQNKKKTECDWRDAEVSCYKQL